jgi:hypothetical protein
LQYSGADTRRACELHTINLWQSLADADGHGHGDAHSDSYANSHCDGAFANTDSNSDAHSDSNTYCYSNGRWA